MVIDIYTHFLPDEYASLIASTTTRKHPDVADIHGLQQVFPNLCKLSSRIQHMDRYGVDIQVLTPLPIPPVQFIASGDRQAPGNLAQVANDALAEVIARSSGRFLGVGLLSFQDIGEAVAEMDRVIMQLGFKGAMLFTNIDGAPLDSPELFPIYERACALDVPLWIHPVSWNYHTWVRDHLLWQIFGWPIDTTLAMARIVYGGVFARFPNLRLITHHAGGTVPFLIGRVSDTFDQVRELSALSGGADERQEGANQSPLDGFRMFYADTALSGVESAFRCAYDMFGAHRMVFGSDYPFGPEQGERFLRTNLLAVKEAITSPSELQRVLQKNALRLLNGMRRDTLAAD